MSILFYYQQSKSTKYHTFTFRHEVNFTNKEERSERTGRSSDMKKVHEHEGVFMRLTTSALSTKFFKDDERFQYNFFQ
jgi:hypothetical protein